MSREQEPARTSAGAEPDAAAVEESWGFPAFARDFPRDPELDALVAAFARGDYRAVRERAPTLAAAATDERVRRACETLRARIEPDPASKLLLVFAAALLAFLTYWWVSHDGPEGAPPMPAAPSTRPSTPSRSD